MYYFGLLCQIIGILLMIIGIHTYTFGALATGILLCLFGTIAKDES